MRGWYEGLVRGVGTRGWYEGLVRGVGTRGWYEGWVAREGDVHEGSQGPYSAEFRRIEQGLGDHRDVEQWQLDQSQQLYVNSFMRSKSMRWEAKDSRQSI